MFADYCLLCREIKRPDDVSIFQADLGRLQSWEAEWLMEFNPSKCEAVTFTKKTKSVKTEYTLHGVLLATVITAKYLGERQHQHLHRAARYCSTLIWCLYEVEEHQPFEYGKRFCIF